MELHDAQDLIDKEIVAHKSATRDLRTLRNTHAGISKLPIELLSKIFVLTKSRYGTPYQETRERRGWLNVAGVCRNWREIALNAPRMWDTLDTSKIRHLDWATAIVARSKNAPLYVRCGPSHPHRDRPVLMFILTHIARVQDMELNLDTSRGPGIEEFLGTSTACLLQSLRLYSEDPPYSTNNGGIHGFLNAVQMPLRRLSYAPLVEGGGPKSTMSAMLSFLRSTPSLERLDISRSLGTSDKGTADCTKVELPKLSFLSYATMRFEDCALFRFIHYPPSSRVKFISHVSPVNTALYTSDLGPILTHMAGSDLVATIEVVSFVAIDSADFSMLATGRHGPMLEMNFPRIEGDLLPLFRFSAMLPRSSAHVLRVCGFCSIIAADWANLFGRHEQVQELTADQVDASFIRALLRQPGTGQPPFMQLKRLILSHCDIEESAVSVERTLEEHRNLASPIDVLEIRDCRVTADIINRLKEYVKVEWDGNDVFEQDLEDEEEEEEEEEDDDWDNYSVTLSDLMAG